MSSCEFVQESEDARLSTRLYLDRCRSTARQLNLKVEKLGDNNEWGWQRDLLPDGDGLCVSELDCLWAGLQALADWMAGQGFEGNVKEQA